MIYTHVRYKEGRGVPSPLDSAYYDTNAGLPEPCCPAQRRGSRSKTSDRWCNGKYRAIIGLRTAAGQIRSRVILRMEQELPCYPAQDKSSSRCLVDIAVKVR